MRLIKALRYSKPISISFVGAGGKTTALFQLAREILAKEGSEDKPGTVLVTTSTHLGTWQAAKADHVFIENSLDVIQMIRLKLPTGVVLVSGEEKDQLLCGLNPKVLDALHQIAEEKGLPLLIEADGAHGCPLKAPVVHEPAIPDFSQQVVVAAGMQGFGKILTKKWVHRPEKFAALSGLQAGEKVTVEALVKVLMDNDGGLKNIPESARRVVLLNQADTAELQVAARGVAERILPTYEAAIVASLCPGGECSQDNTGPDRMQPAAVHAVIEPIAGIILAAGGSSRFGQPKQLLKWKGQPMISHVASIAIRAGLAPVVIVTGSSAEAVQDVVKNSTLRIAYNPNWMDGISSSIKTGIKCLPSKIGGAVFLQCDQPQIPLTLVRALIDAHQTSMKPIIAPKIDGQRGNPVLFDINTFLELLNLKGDVGGRALFKGYPIQWVPWRDANLLIDIDSPEDYARLLKIYHDEEVHP